MTAILPTTLFPSFYQVSLALEQGRLHQILPLIPPNLNWELFFACYYGDYEVSSQLSQTRGTDILYGLYGSYLGMRGVDEVTFNLVTSALRHNSTGISPGTFFLLKLDEEDMVFLRRILAGDRPYINTEAISWIYYQSRDGHQKVVELLLESGADLHLALEGAIQGNHRSLVEDLVNRLEAQQLGKKKCMISVAVGQKNLQMIQYLISHGFLVGTYALDLAAIVGNLDILQYLLQQAPDQVTLQTMLMAIENSNLKTVKCLFEWDDQVKMINWLDDPERSQRIIRKALHYDLKGKIVQYLIQRGIAWKTAYDEEKDRLRSYIIESVEKLSL